MHDKTIAVALRAPRARVHRSPRDHPMRITRLITSFLSVSLCFAEASAAQSSSAQTSGTQIGQGAGAMPGHANVPMPSGTHADSALLTGPLGTRAPTGIATVEGRTVRLALTGDQPGSSRAWYVHRGSCTRDEGMVGAARAYAPLVIDSRGAGSGSVALDAPFVAGGAYFVAVHASATDPQSDVIVCGPFTKGAMNTGQSARAMANSPMGNMPMSNMPMASMPGTDHSMTLPGMSGSNVTGSSMPDSVSALVTAIYSRMMADPVIRERAMTDPVLWGMLARVPTTLQPPASTNAAALHDAMNTPGMTMPASTLPAKRAAAPTASKSAARPATRSSSSTSASKSAQKPAQKAAAKPAPKPAAKPAPKNPMPSMPGMDHGNMPGKGKP